MNLEEVVVVVMEEVVVVVTDEVVVMEEVVVGNLRLCPFGFIRSLGPTVLGFKNRKKKGRRAAVVLRCEGPYQLSASDRL